MSQDEIRNAALEFEKAENWKRPRGGSKFTWRQLVQKDVHPFAKPLKISQKWEESWFDRTKEIAVNQLQWKTLVRDAHVAGNGQ